MGCGITISNSMWAMRWTSVLVWIQVKHLNHFSVSRHSAVTESTGVRWSCEPRRSSTGDRCGKRQRQRDRETRGTGREVEREERLFKKFLKRETASAELGTSRLAT
jgi:hypothetical protein